MPVPSPDQGEHVELAVAQRSPGAGEERRAAPQHDWRCEHANSIQPAQAATAQLRSHAERRDRQGQNEAHPEPSAHIGEFGIVLRRCSGLQRLERHAADGAGAGRVLPHLGMHRAGPDGVLRRRGRGSGFRREIFRRVRHEFLAAGFAAEEIAVARMLGAMRRLLRIDAHSAHRIARCSRRGLVCVMVVRVVHGSTVRKAIGPRLQGNRRPRSRG